MRRKKYRYINTALLIFFIMIAMHVECISFASVIDDEDIIETAEIIEGGIDAPENLVVKQSGNGSLKLKWKKVKGASEYGIYKAEICLGGYKRVAVTEKTTWTDRKVKPDDSGTYKVVTYAYREYATMLISRFSYPVSAKVCTKKSKRRNASKVKASLNKSHSARITLNCGESFDKKKNKLSAKVYGPRKKGTQGRWHPLNGRVRWYSTDPSLVKIKSATNIIAGEKQGKCYIYAIAHNGAKSNKIPVQVNAPAQ